MLYKRWRGSEFRDLRSLSEADDSLLMVMRILAICLQARKDGFGSISKTHRGCLDFGTWLAPSNDSVW